MYMFSRFSAYNTHTHTHTHTHAHTHAHTHTHKLLKVFPKLQALFTASFFGGRCRKAVLGVWVFPSTKKRYFR